MKLEGSAKLCYFSVVLPLKNFLKSKKVYYNIGFKF